MVDLRQVVVKYNFEKYMSAGFELYAALPDLFVDEIMRNMGHSVFQALRRLMKDVASNRLNQGRNNFWLQIDGLQPRKHQESYVGAMHRLLGQPKADKASAEALVQEIFWRACQDAPTLRDAGNFRLATFEGIPLYLSV